MRYRNLRSARHRTEAVPTQEKRKEKKEKEQRKAKEHDHSGEYMPGER